MVAVPEVPSGRRPGGGPTSHEPRGGCQTLSHLQCQTLALTMWGSHGCRCPQLPAPSPPRGREGSHSPIPCRRDRGSGPMQQGLG